MLEVLGRFFIGQPMRAVAIAVLFLVGYLLKRNAAGGGRAISVLVPRR